MGWFPGRVGRMVWSLSALLVPLTFLTFYRSAMTVAILTDMKDGSSVLQASTSSPPVVTPTVVDLGILRVGDRCENAPIIDIRNTSPWRVYLSVTATGWLDQPGDVSIWPSSLGPGEVATVFFTKAAVGPPIPITGQIIISAEPGGYLTVVELQGSVENPSGSASEPYPLPHGCVSTPRVDGGKAAPTDPAATPAEPPPAEPPPAEPPPAEPPPADPPQDGPKDPASEEQPKEGGSP